MSGPEVWCVLTMKEGHVSILKNLTEAECRATVQRLRGGDPWSQEAIYAKVVPAPHPHAGWLAGNSTTQQLYAQQAQLQQIQHVRSAGSWGVDRCEWWGSKDGKLEIWPKPDDYDARLAEAMKVVALVSATNAAIDQKAA